jgi:hypothetical protein
LPLYQGFIDEENQITAIHGSPDFERYHKFNIKQLFEKKNITLKELTTLSVGLCNTRSRNRTLWRFAKNTGREQNTGSYKTGLC